MTDQAVICIEAGVDSIEHGLQMTDAQVQGMAQKGIYYVPTLYVYNAPSRESGIEDPEASKFPASACAWRQNRFRDGCGLRSPRNDLRAGTSLAADLMGWQDQVGTVEKGKYANLVAVEGDPLKDITELARVEFVMKGGSVIRNDLK